MSAHISSLSCRGFITAYERPVLIVGSFTEEVLSLTTYEGKSWFDNQPLGTHGNLMGLQIFRLFRL